MFKKVKRCIKCKETKPITDFSSNKKLVDGLCNWCRSCVAVNSKKWYSEHRENRFRWKINPKRKKETDKNWRQNHKEKCCAYSRKYRSARRDQINAATLKYKKTHREQWRAYGRKYNNRKRAALMGNLNHRMSRAIRKSVGINKNGRKWEKLVGYTTTELKKHLEAQFINGMNWEAFLHGDIHIDHVVPISLFRYDKPEDPEFRICWGLQNLQPLWGMDNIKKSNHLVA